MEDDWPGDTYSIHLDYVILKFVDVHHDRLKHRLATTFTEEWDEHLEQRLVGIELKKKYQEIEKIKFPTLAASTRSSGMMHDYSIKLREEAALSVIGTEESMAFAEHALCLRLWKDGWDSDYTSKSFLILFECLYKYNNENKDLRSLILMTENSFELFADGKHEDAHDRCLNLKANAAIAQSDWVLAANAYEKLIKVREMRFGIGSPKAAEAYTWLGQVYGKADKWNEAYTLFKQAYNSYVIKLGENHIDTLNCKKILANSLMEIGQFSESEIYYLSLPTNSSTNNVNDGKKGQKNNPQDNEMMKEKEKALAKLYQLLELSS